MKHLILSLLIILSAAKLSATALTFPYSNGFEDATENVLWTFNAGAEGATCTDKWYVGSPADAAIVNGVNALYISSNGGVNPIPGTDNNVVVAYRVISLPASITGPKRLDLTFDWKTMVPTNINNNIGSGIRVALIDDSFPLPVESLDDSGVEPAWLSSSKLTMNLHDGSRRTVLRDNPSWESAHTSLNMRPGEVKKLVFVWINEGGHTEDERRLAACIDNIQITSADCPMPTPLVINDGCDSTEITWHGSMGSSYTLEYRLTDAPTWNIVNNLTTTSYAIPRLQEGIYDFRVRSNCGTEVSAYQSVYSTLVFCPDNHCINYIDLESEDITCFIGYAQPDAAGGNSFAPVAPVDYGSQAPTSRHTIHWDPNEYDKYTNNKLKTVPPGEFASIRIGDHHSGALAERIEIDYWVDINVASVLLMNYAIVFQEPDHIKEEQPYFRLRLVTETGLELDPTCGKAEFYSDPRDPEWTRESTSSGTIAWKDWSYIGFDLTLLHGQKITIQIDSRDCTQGAHFAYAYFALGCAAGELQGVSCGAVDTMLLEAPAGFDYEWTTQTSPSTILGTEQHYVARSSNETYVCRCISKIAGPGQCDFTMSTTISPRVPHSQYASSNVANNCKNIVQLINESDVFTKDDVTGDMVTTGEHIGDVYWDFGDGTKHYGDTIEIEVPKSGGTFTGKLVARIEGGCEDTSIISLDIPSILTVPDTTLMTLCFGESVDFEKSHPGGGIFGKDTTATARLTNQYGCDSLRVLVLDVKDRIPDETTDTIICHGDTVDYDGQKYSTTGRYTVRDFTDDGCEFRRILNLTVRPAVTFTTTTTPEAGSPNTGSITIENAPVNYIYFIDGVQDGQLTGLKGGTYEVYVLDTNNCPSEIQYVVVDKVCLQYTLDYDQDLLNSICSGIGNEIVIPVTPIAGKLSKYSVSFDQKAVDAGFTAFVDTFDVNEITIIVPDQCRADRYTAKIAIADGICPDSVIDIRFTVLYSEDVIMQKWNNVLAVKNKDYNGGYDFVAFRWYINGAIILNEVTSILYLGEGNSFDFNSQYWAELQRADDGQWITTCPILPVMKVEEQPYPTLSASIATLSSRVSVDGLDSDAEYRIYTPTGALIDKGTINEYDAEIQVPSQAGVYLITIAQDNGTKTHKILVVE